MHLIYGIACSTRELYLLSKKLLVPVTKVKVKCK